MTMLIAIILDNAVLHLMLFLLRWVSSILDGIKSDSVRNYVGEIRTFSKRMLGFASRFHEQKEGSKFVDFTGCPFNSQAVDDVIYHNRKHKIASGEPPRKRAEPLFYDDTHRALQTSWVDRHPEVFQRLLKLFFPTILLHSNALPFIIAHVCFPGHK